MESLAIETEVKPKYVNTKASAILLIILETMLDSSLAWKDKLKKAYWDMNIPQNNKLIIGE